MTMQRDKYMDAKEAERLRTIVRGWDAADRLNGRRQGVVAWALIDTVTLTGLRVNELVALTVDDLNVRHNTLKVRRSKRRQVVIDSLAIPHDLTKHLASFVEWKGQTGEPTDADSPLFCSKRGPMSVRGAQHLFKTCAKRAGLPDKLSIHSCRHSVGMALLAKTGDIKQVQQQLGHARIDTTAGIYAHHTDRQMRAGVTDLYHDEEAA